MIKSRNVTVSAFIIHLIICMIFSFDWDFLEGIYLGYFVTFSALYLLTIPLIIASAAIYNSAIVFYYKKSNGLMKLNGILGTLIFLCYLLSWLGLFESSRLQGAVYFFVFVFVAAIFVISVCNIIINRKKTTNRG